jgi:hypothetical protein
MRFHDSKLAMGLAFALLAAGGAASVGAADQKQPLPADVGDLSNAAEVEVRDSSGQAVLRGRLEVDEDEADKEKKGRLTATAEGAGAGEAEVEVRRNSSGAVVRQEVEIKVEKLAAGASFTIHVDGKQVGSITTDAKGTADVEFVSAVGR